jgi:hypothetical protein
MKDVLQIILKAKLAQRDKFILLVLVCIAWLVNSFTALLLAKQVPDIVERVLEVLHVL